MAKESSFDVVSVVDVQELDNAISQAARELTQRYDLKDSGATLELNKKDQQVKLSAPSEFVAQQVRDIVAQKCAKRSIDLTALVWGAPQAASGMSVRQVATVLQGIPQDVAKRISKDIRDSKLKVKVQTEGDKLRVSSASRDALQEVIALLKNGDYGQPLQYVNYR